MGDDIISNHNNRYMRCELTTVYGKIDIFGYKPNKKYKLTVHHIKPVREGGKTTLENTCLLREDIHIRFNFLESIDPENGDYINDTIKKLKLINKRR